MQPTRTALALLCIAVGACGDRRADVATDTMIAADSLVPIADASPLVDTTSPTPAPETVYVAPTPAPRPSPVRPTPRRPAPAPAPSPAPAARAMMIETGTNIATTAIETITSKSNKVGDMVSVRVANDVSDANGRVVIPAGSIVSLSVVEIGPADSRGEKGTLTLSARSVSINGTSYPLTARATDYAYKMDAGKIDADDVAKTGAGAVAGAVIGRVVGGRGGTAVGAVGGAVAGGAIAAKTARRDIIVEAGNAVTLTLRDDFRRS